MAGVGVVARSHHERGHPDLLELLHPLERERARHHAHRVSKGVEVAVALEPLARDLAYRLPPSFGHARLVRLHEAVDPAALEAAGQAVPRGELLVALARPALVRGRDLDEGRDSLREL